MVSTPGRTATPSLSPGQTRRAPYRARATRNDHGTPRTGGEREIKPEIYQRPQKPLPPGGLAAQGGRWPPAGCSGTCIVYASLHGAQGPGLAGPTVSAQTPAWVGGWVGAGSNISCSPIPMPGRLREIQKNWSLSHASTST